MQHHLLARSITQAVKTNLATGRFARIAAARSPRNPLTLDEYIASVTTCTRAEYARVQALQAGDATAWNALRDFLTRRAQRITRNVRPDATLNDALEFADETCYIIFNKPYPFDAPFAAWATLILHRLILTRWTRSRDALDQARPPASLDAPGLGADDPTPLGDQIPNPRAQIAFERVEDRAGLLAALELLRSDAQRVLLRRVYLDGASLPALARELGISRQAVYNLHRRALARLREILKSNHAQDS
ncbi:MAG: sigma-70 family RNA polymerase sigma factor [Chloroflexi bacterium]|nr:sigma-70 family RNA polymerase sigma factor [Chloroflexota bacterium]